MNRLTSTVLIAVFAVIGSGTLQFVHLQQHLQEAAIAARQGKSPLHHRSNHDQDNCAVCTALQMPTLSQGYVPILLTLGLLVAFAAQFVLRSRSFSVPLCIDCRGPPIVH